MQLVVKAGAFVAGMITFWVIVLLLGALLGHSTPMPGPAYRAIEAVKQEREQFLAEEEAARQATYTGRGNAPEKTAGWLP